MKVFANEELVKAFLRGLLSDERVHGVPLDALPSMTDLLFKTKQQSVEETVDMVAFCTAMQCDTERCSVSVRKARRTPSGRLLYGRVHLSTFASCFRNHESTQVSTFLLKNAKTDLT